MAILNIKNLPDALYGKLQARAKRQHPFVCSSSIFWWVLPGLSAANSR
jgi:hypothetical protein